jgi:hypothetical protein
VNSYLALQKLNLFLDNIQDYLVLIKYLRTIVMVCFTRVISFSICRFIILREVGELVDVGLGGVDD